MNNKKIIALSLIGVISFFQTSEGARPRITQPKRAQSTPPQRQAPTQVPSISDVNIINAANAVEGAMQQLKTALQNQPANVQQFVAQKLGFANYNQLVAGR